MQHACMSGLASSRYDVCPCHVARGVLQVHQLPDDGARLAMVSAVHVNKRPARSTSDRNRFRHGIIHKYYQGLSTRAGVNDIPVSSVSFLISKLMTFRFLTISLDTNKKANCRELQTVLSYCTSQEVLSRADFMTVR